MLKLVFIAAALSITLSGCGLFSKTPQSVSNAFQKLETPKSALATKYEALIPNVTQSNSWEDPIDIVSLSNLKVLGTLNCWNISNIFQSGNEIITDAVSTSGNTFIMTKSGHVKSYRNKDKKLDWSYDLGFNLKDVRNASATLTHKDAKLYVTVHQHFIVLSAKDGSEIFYKKLSNKITSGVCVAEDIAYFNDVSNLYAIDILSGRILYTSPGVANSLVIESKTQPAFYESNALFSNHFCGQLTLVDTKQIGQPLLQIPIPFAKKGPINLFMPNLISQPIIDKNNSCIYLASHTGMIQKYDIKKECVIWSKNIHSLQRLSKIGNTLVAITLARQAIAINSLNGEIVWVADLELNPKILHEFLAPLCINGNLVLLSRTGNLIELNPKNGQVLFCTNIKLKNAISMAVVNDKLRIYTANKMLENN
jgi:outer membrane protein assembly factor BamB